ncbi:unnamed protein product, partial [Staurois parvus]
ILHFRGGGLLCLLTVLLRQLGHTAQHSHLEQCEYSEAHRHRPRVKHTQHTVNPLIAPHVDPFLPSIISTASVLFISTDHCIGVTEDASDTQSVPYQCQNVHRSPAI